MPCKNIIICWVSSPVGSWRASGCSQGLHWVKLAPEVTNDNFLEKGKNVSLAGWDIGSDGHFHQCVTEFEQWLKDYFHEHKDNHKITICQHEMAKMGSEFRQKVWLTLKENVPFGQTISYGALANLSGH